MLKITPELLLQAYRISIFPMGERRDDPKLYWLDPRLRAADRHGKLHVYSPIAADGRALTVRAQR